MTEKVAPKLTLGTKLGYSAGIFADTLGYSMFYSYFFTFLTSVVGVSAGLAGVISSIGILWDGINDPIIGYMADNGKPGRRRKMMKWSAIPYALAVFCTYLSVDFGTTGNAIYFILCTLAFWWFYTMVCVPFYSVVPELTPDYNERVGLRNFTAWINTFANLITLACPMLLVQFFGKFTKTPNGGWAVTAGFFGVIIIAAAWICSNTIKKAEERNKAAGFESDQKEREKVPFLKSVVNLFKTFIEVLFTKQVLILFIAMVLCNVYRGYTSTGFTTFMLYNVGLISNIPAVSVAYAILIASWLIYFPVVNWACSKWDKKVVLIGGALITFILRTAIGFLSFSSTLAGLYVHIFISNFITTTYLGVAFAMPYDLAEVYEYKHNGVRADSTIQSVPFMAQKIGAAIGSLIWGFTTQAAGFDGTAIIQTERTNKIIQNTFCGWINILIIGYIVILAFYKMDRKHTSAVQAANQARKEGKSVSDKEFADIL